MTSPPAPSAPRRACVGFLVLAILTSAVPLRAQSPWLAADLRVARDNQVRSALQVAASYGRYFGADATLAVGVAAHRFTGEAGYAPGVGSTTASAGVTGTLALPSARMGVEGGLGVLSGLPGEGGDGGVEVAGRLLARRHLGAWTALRLSAARERYTGTLSSLDTAVMAVTVEGALDRSGAPGWAWEAVARRTDHGDDNPVTSAYAWILAPLSRSAGHALRAGYGVSRHDARYATWAPVPSGSGGGTGPFPRPVEGRYTPYYAPHDVVVHMLLANGALAVGGGWLLADGGVGVRATETAPVLVRPAAGADPALGFYRRSFTPWRARASVVFPTDERTSVTVALGFDRTTYYRAGTLRLALTRAM